MADEVEPDLKKKVDEKCVKCHKLIRKIAGIPLLIATDEAAEKFSNEYGFLAPVGGVICSNCRSILRLSKSKRHRSERQELEACKELDVQQTKSPAPLDVVAGINSSDFMSTSSMPGNASSDDNAGSTPKKAKIRDNRECVSCKKLIRKTEGNTKNINTREEAINVLENFGLYTQIGDAICFSCYSLFRLEKSKKKMPVQDETEVMLDLEQNMSQVSVEKSSHRGSSLACSQVQSQSQDFSSNQQLSNESQDTTTSSQMTHSSNSDSTYYDSDHEANEMIELPFSRSISSHAYCFICGQRDSKLIQDVPFSARLQVFAEVRIFIPRRNRCCEEHLIKNRFYAEELNKISIFSKVCSIEVGEVKRFLDVLSDKVDVTLHTQISDQMLSEERIRSLTGYSWENIRQLEGMMTNMRNTANRNILQALIIFLIKLRTGNSNSCISAILEIEESVVENAINAVLNCFETEIPKYFGLDAYDRDFFISQSSAVAKKLYNLENRLALICDGTYLRHEKSSNNAYQRKSYSGQKHTHLCKPFTIATTNGFVVELAGPYKANMNDAQILRKVIDDPNGLSKILKQGDIFILDRGFRDVVDFLKSKRYEVFMPALKGKRNQLSVEESNASRLVTKVRWVVEAVHGIIGQKSKLLHHQFNNKLLPHAKIYCQIACLLSNLFCKRLNSDDDQMDSVIERMNATKNLKNTLSDDVEKNNWNRKTVPFSKASSKDLLDFPEMTMNDLKLFFTGSYQLSQAISYLAEMLKDDNSLDLNYCKAKPSIIRFEVRSRHINSKTYKCYVHYQPNSIGVSGIKRYCCNCANGNRTVGCCSHVAAVVYYLSHARYLSKIVLPAQQLGNLFDCNEVCPVIDEDSDED